MDNTPEYVNPGTGLPDISPTPMLSAREVARKAHTVIQKHKTQYDTGYMKEVYPCLDAICAWRRDGLTIEEIAAKLNVHKRRLYRYKNKYPEFAAILTYNKDQYIASVENSVYTSANGETIKEEEYETIIVDDKKFPELNGKVLSCTKVKTKIKQVPKNFLAGMAILKNRAPKKWNTADKIELSGELNVAALMKDIQDKSERERAERLGLDPAKEVVAEN